jgi:hypothetical protein
VKFLYSDSLDFVDPDFDFVRDRSATTRRAHQDDDYPHEHLEQAPYDGLLVSRAIVGGGRRTGKYSDAQSMRFHREGARAFLRFPESRYPNSIIMGDNGAFTYRNEAEPPYTVDDTLEFYEDGGFTHGCAVDHLVFDFIEDGAPPSAIAKARTELTLTLAAEFLPAARRLGASFTPVGVVQGWSPDSMADAARQLVQIGYDYIAVGGMVPLQIDQIERALAAIRAQIPDRVRLHLLGFGKTDDLPRVAKYGVASFDTTSPLLRAFKDAKRNYYSSDREGRLQYYTAIRIPQALESSKTINASKTGRLDQDALLRLESAALTEVRRFAARECEVETALEAVMAYGRYALWDVRSTEAQNERRMEALAEAYRITLTDRPWTGCACRVCRESGVEALIFRSSNRNKRRGFHNLHVFYNHLRSGTPVSPELAS